MTPPPPVAAMRTNPDTIDLAFVHANCVSGGQARLRHCQRLHARRHAHAPNGPGGAHLDWLPARELSGVSARTSVFPSSGPSLSAATFYSPACTSFPTQAPAVLAPSAELTSAFAEPSAMSPNSEIAPRAFEPRPRLGDARERAPLSAFASEPTSIARRSVSIHVSPHRRPPLSPALPSHRSR